ncbi:MAG: virulence RhuM family protein, partial [Gammaproteobacteria bacterium]|nr:virulence RhuM family protein [Gammaproteobacteria bacterium]
MKPTSEIVIYDGGEARVEVRVERENVWLSLQQLADLFGRDKSVISRHLRNIFASEELERDAVVAKNATTAADGKTYLVEYFNLDVIISVGYRVNSTRATRFRQWATRILREHLTQGYSLDRQRFEHNAAELEAALALVKKAAAGETLTAELGRGLVDVIARYTQTFLWLQRYDEGLLTAPAGSPGGVLPTLAQAHAAIARLKADLMARGEASDLFGRERGDAFAAILGNLEQTVFGEPAYPSVEAKAA